MNMVRISRTIAIADKELEFSAIRAQGAGGQNVNKVSSAIHLRFDIRASSLPDNVKARLLALKDSRISHEGIVIIKAQRHRSQDKNREDAIHRLVTLVQKAMLPRKKRIATKPTKTSQQKRLDSKTRHGQQKTLRRKVTE